MRIPNMETLNIKPGDVVDVYMLDGWRVGTVITVNDNEIRVNVTAATGGRFDAWVTPGQVRKHIPPADGVV